MPLRCPVFDQLFDVFHIHGFVVLEDLIPLDRIEQIYTQPLLVCYPSYLGNSGSSRASMPVWGRPD